VEWLRLVMNIYIEETSDTCKVVHSRVMNNLKWLRIIEDDVKFKWLKYGIPSVNITYDFEVKDRMLDANYFDDHWGRFM
jgi:hypothetical protein